MGKKAFLNPKLHLVALLVFPVRSHSIVDVSRKDCNYRIASPFSAASRQGTPSLACFLTPQAGRFFHSFNFIRRIYEAAILIRGGLRESGKKAAIDLFIGQCCGIERSSFCPVRFSISKLPPVEERPSG